MTDLARLRELLEKATKGPWASGRIRIGGADPRFDGCDIGSIDGSNIAIVLHQECDRNQKETVANADLITEMMRVMPDLLDEVERLRAALRLIVDRADEPWGNEIMRTNRLAIIGAMAALAMPSLSTKEVMTIHPKPSSPSPTARWLSTLAVGGYKRKPSRTVAQDKRDARKARNRRSSK